MLHILVLLCLTRTWANTIPTDAENLNQLNVIEKSVNHNVEPCEDFYAYACGNWEQSPWALSGSKFIGDVLEKAYLESLKNMLHQQYPDKETIKKQHQGFREKVATFYHSCRSNKTFDFFNVLKPGKDIEWPLIRELQDNHTATVQDFRNFDLFAFLGQLHSYGFHNFLINFFVQREPNGILHMFLGVPRGEYFSPYTVERMLGNLSWDMETQRHAIAMHSREIKETHNNWRKVYNKYSEEGTQQQFTYGVVKDLYPAIAKFLENFLPNQIKSNDIVDIFNIQYFEYLAKKEWQNEELLNYLMVQFYKYIRKHFDKDCIGMLNTQLHVAVNYMYRQHSINKEANKTFIDLSQQIYKHLLEVVSDKNLELSARQIHMIKDKLQKLHIKVGNLPENADDAFVEEFYSLMPDFDMESYTRNLLWSFQQRIREITSQCPKGMECVFVPSSSIRYNPNDNTLELPVKLFVPPMYHWKFHPLFAVSLMGNVISHEFTHSMDITSLSSNLENDIISNSHVNTLMECVKNQQPTDEGSRVCLADLVAAKVAYRTYSQEYSEQPNFSKIPWQQLFFLNMAQNFCQISNLVLGNDHVASNIRLLQIAMNLNEFAQAFHCPVGSKMNPEKKCGF